MPIKRKDEENETTKTTETTKDERKGIDNKLELLKYAAEVQSRLKNQITSDFVLCKLGEQDKIGVTEMTVNAYLAARQVNNIKRNAYKWEYNKEKQKWEKHEITEYKEEKETLDAYEEKVFDTFMTRVEMCAILNRNEDKNNMIEVLSGLRQEEIKTEEENKQEDGMVKKLISKMKKKDTKEEENEK